MRTSNVVIRTVESDSELEAICRFRYLIYVEEMNRIQHYADHTNKTIKDPLDNNAHNLAAWLDNEVVGVLRLNISSESDLGYYEAFYQMESVGHWHPKSTGIITRLMLLPDFRNTDLAMRLSLAGFEFGLQNGIRYSFMDCNDHLVEFFSWFGWRKYIGQVEHPEYGLVTPMKLDLHDCEYFKKIKSPFLGALERHLMD